MDFISTLSAAIHYMEEHLTDPITYEDVAKHLYISSYHFHRTFSLITGMTASEYIRNRRLSLAGQELLVSDTRVIDVALKYGYESPESFTKAYTRFHGITPNATRQSGASLKLFNRLQIKIIVKGGKSMDYRIERRKPFTLLAKVREFQNEIINQEGNTEIPEFWTECQQNSIVETLRQHATSADLYGACAPISKESDHFTYGIGVEYTNTIVPKELTIWEVKPELWAVFPCIGTSGECIGETWNKIMTEFLPNSEYTMLDDVDFELYSPNLPAECFCEVWIPVAKK